MDRTKYCGCKGVRSCIKCENMYHIISQNSTFTDLLKNLPSYVYCDACNASYPGWEMLNSLHCNDHTTDACHIQGISLIRDFISRDEEAQLVQHLDEISWDVSQSGRRKQVLTLTKYNGGEHKYNLIYSDYNTKEDEHLNCVVRIPMPRRSLLILTKEARYAWLHSILRKDISGRRICLAYREFSPSFLASEWKSEGARVLQIAKDWK